MYGIDEVNNMLYYIIENDVCKCICSTSKSVNDWVKTHRKRIIHINKFGNMVKVEVK